MAYKIAIASGKGGTGKTTVSVNLNLFLKQIYKSHIHLVDCDVEEPNDLLFFKNPHKDKEESITQLIPEMDNDKCVFCGKCEEYCEFNAITIIPKAKYIAVDKGLCHSCDACLEACEYQAITERPYEIGKVNHYTSEQGCKLSEGRLDVGSPMQTPLIKALKKRIPNDADIILFDAPPGTSCSVVETINDSDYVILVAEPTLFGLHDFKLMVELVRDLSIPFGLVINKAGLGSDEIYEYIKEEHITLLGEIPFSKAYAGLYAQGKLTDDVSQEITDSYTHIISQLEIKK